MDKIMKVARPRGIFSSLPTGIDALLKAKMDDMRGQQVGEIQGWTYFADAALLKKRRQWNSSDLKYNDGKGNVLIGALDDIIENAETKLVAPFDVKTKGSKPDLEYCEKYYQNQMDLYALLLSQKHHVADFGILYYFWPAAEDGGMIKFDSAMFRLTVSADRGKALFEKAIACLESPMPAASHDCAYCKFVEMRGSTK